MRLLSLGRAAALAVLAGLPYVAGSNYLTEIAITATVFLVLSLSLNLVYGVAGILSFAQLGFWGIGGYGAALMAHHLHAPLWQCLAVAMAVPALLSFAIGWPSLRLSRHAFIVVTVAFSILASLLARDWIALTNGPAGIPGIAPPALAGYTFHTPLRFYGLSLAACTLLCFVIWLVGSSRVGRALHAIRQSESLAQSHGAAPNRYRLFALAIGAAATGAMGGLYVLHLGVVDPVIFDFYYMQTMLIIVILGGKGSFWSVAFTALLMTVVPELLRASTDLRMVAYGALLLLAMRFMPQGFAGLLRERRARAWRKELS